MRHALHLARTIAWLLATAPVGLATAGEAVIVSLTQVHCQFIESENNRDHRFAAGAQLDCEMINAATGPARLAAAPILELAPGPTIFRVTNRDVGYTLGFFLRGDGLHNFERLPRVSGGGLTPGSSRDFYINLVPGAYIYSCPLNPTLDYKLVVR